MQSHQSLTAAYLEGCSAAGVRAGEITSTVSDSVTATSYGARALTRPVFLVPTSTAG